MQIGIIIILLLIAVFLWRLAFGPRFLSAASNEWLALEKHKVNHDYGKEIPTVEIEFEPIIGWQCHRCGYRAGKLMPVTPIGYRAHKWLATKNKYKLLSYWLHDGVTVVTLDEWSDDNGDFWENLSKHSTACKNIEIQGNVPNCFQSKISKILAMKSFNQE